MPGLSEPGRMQERDRRRTAAGLDEGGGVATLAEQFKKARGNIEPDPADVSNAAATHAAVREVLKDDATLKGWGIDPVLIGSYSREVSIRRVKDVDVFGRLATPPAELRPGRALDEFHRVLEDAYKSRVEPQHRSFKVDCPAHGLAVDVVPARACGAHWEIASRPDQRGRWGETDPTKLGELTTQMTAAQRSWRCCHCSGVRAAYCTS